MTQREEFTQWYGSLEDGNPTFQEAFEAGYLAGQAAQTAQIPEGYKLAPVEPPEAMWSELARDIVFWLYATSAPHYGSKMHDHLRNLGREIPDWLTTEIPDVDHTPSKGAVAVCIYKAMLDAAPSTKEKTNG